MTLLWMRCAAVTWNGFAPIHQIYNRFLPRLRLGRVRCERAPCRHDCRPVAMAYMRFGQERMSVLHACHKIQFSDEVLEEWTANCPIEAYYVKERDHLFSARSHAPSRGATMATRAHPAVRPEDWPHRGSGYSIGDASTRMVCAAGGCEDLSRFLRAFVHQWPFKHPADLCCYHADATFSRIQLYLRYHRIHMDFNALVTAELPIMYGTRRMTNASHSSSMPSSTRGASMERALSIVRRKHPGLTMHFRGHCFTPYM